ncbi:hypothetical protein NSQ59_27670 [Margalitia sp. FSL K6-0131]|uniref:hypothetical protein n=1 Tax=Margalitia sp. FSL K6-0131 TaxID=2954604 RepID=UPI0030F5B981
MRNNQVVLGALGKGKNTFVFPEMKEFYNVNTVLMGYAATGKTQTLRYLIEGSLCKNKKILLLDFFNENMEFTNNINGENVSVGQIERLCETKANFINLYFAKDRYFEKSYLDAIYDILYKLPADLYKLNIDYLVIDEGQRLISPNYLDIFLEILEIVNGCGIHIILSVQNLYEEWNELTKTFPYKVIFNDTFRYPEIHQITDCLPRGHSILIDSKNKPLYAIRPTAFKH